LLHLSKKIKRKSWYKLYCCSLMEIFRIWTTYPQNSLENI
jgi:hypothetical protein